MTRRRASVRPVSVERWVYFVQAGGDGGPIKIGSSGDVGRRLGVLRSDHYEELVVLGSCLGGFVREYELHDELAEARIRGEWFRPTEAVLAAVERCTAEGDDWDSLDNWMRRAGGLVPVTRERRSDDRTVSTGES